VQGLPARLLFWKTRMEAHVAMVLMVRVNADAPPQQLPREFDAHEVIVADSIDEAVAASSQRAPDLILLPDTLSMRQQSLDGVNVHRSAQSADDDAAKAQWIYWFGSRQQGLRRSLTACEFLELVRQYLEPAEGTM
jgi:hypothetical protein